MINATHPENSNHLHPPSNLHRSEVLIIFDADLEYKIDISGSDFMHTSRRFRVIETGQKETRRIEGRTASQIGRCTSLSRIGGQTYHTTSQHRKKRTKQKTKTNAHEQQHSPNPHPSSLTPSSPTLSPRRSLSSVTPSLGASGHAMLGLGAGGIVGSAECIHRGLELDGRKEREDYVGGAEGEDELRDESVDRLMNHEDGDS